MNDLVEFLKAFEAHLVVVYTGSIVNVAVTVYTTHFKRPAPKKTMSAFFIGCIFWACFLTYQDLSRQANDLKELARIATLNADKASAQKAEAMVQAQMASKQARDLRNQNRLLAEQVKESQRQLQEAETQARQSTEQVQKLTQMLQARDSSRNGLGPGSPATRDPHTTPAKATAQKHLARTPTLTYKPNPRYTADARARRIQGTVIVRANFKRNGSVQVMGVERGLGYGLDEEASRAVSGIRFEPAKDDDGNFTDWEGVATVTFQISTPED